MTAGAHRLIHVGERLRVQTEESLSVISHDHEHSCRHPEDRPGSGRHEPPGQSGIASGIEVQDCTHPLQDLTQRIYVAHELERARKCLNGDSTARRGKAEIDEEQEGNELTWGT